MYISSLENNNNIIVQEEDNQHLKGYKWAVMPTCTELKGLLKNATDWNWFLLQIYHLSVWAIY